ncbi:MAG: hypothetical protein H6835_05720 [Planctomycetes bacterium]|nr:hypothetical protein [Planctomycetota bacterium]
MTVGPAQGATAGGPPSVSVQVPDGWKKLSSSGRQFRDAEFQVTGEPDTDCYLTLGVGGGAAGNLGRWFGQFGRSDVPTVSSLPAIELAGKPARLVALEGAMGGKDDWAALIAFFADGAQVTSLKFTGPRAVVQQHRDGFLALARAIKLGGSSGGGARQAPPIQPGAQMPADHPGAAHPGGGAAAPAPVANDGPFTADVPSGWQAKAGKPMHHTFGEAGEVYISMLGSNLGQAIGIWRGEFVEFQGAPPPSEADLAALPNVQFLGDDAVLLDVKGHYKGMSGKEIAAGRMLVAARFDGGTLTFCKLIGTAGDVEAQRDAFLAFLGSVRRNQ